MACPRESSQVPFTIASAHRHVSGCMSCASPAFVSHFICRQGIASIAPLIMEKLFMHNLNKPPFCSLSILNTLPISSVLQLAATQHLFIAAGCVSETLIEQQKSSSFKQTALVNRPKCCKRCQDCSRPELHRLVLEMVFFSMYSEYSYSTCISLGRRCRCSCLTRPFSCE